MSEAIYKAVANILAEFGDQQQEKISAIDKQVQTVSDQSVPFAEFEKCLGALDERMGAIEDGFKSSDFDSDQLASELNSAMEEKAAQFANRMTALEQHIKEKISLMSDAFAAVEKALKESIDQAKLELSVQDDANKKAFEEQTEALEEFQCQLAAMDKKLDSIPAGEPGQDRPLVEPVVINDRSHYEKNTLGTWDNSLWIAKRKANGSPEDDPAAWHCVIAGMASIEVEPVDGQNVIFKTRLGDGRGFESPVKIPSIEYKGLWQEGEAYYPGQIVTKGTALWHCKEHTEHSPPGNGWEQALVSKRGPRGYTAKEAENG